MAKGKKRGPADKAYYKTYPSKYEVHRIRKLERHLKKHPEDKQAQKALDKGDFEYRRNVKGVHKEIPINKKRAERREEMMKRQLKSIPRVEKPYLPMLQELYNALRPKIKYKKRRDKRIPKTV